MRDTVFIQTNPKQIIGAKVAAHALKRHSNNPDSFDVRILSITDFPFFAAREGQRYAHNVEGRIWRTEDLQSFTLLRFAPPELMNYSGRAIVLDPDCFVLADIRGLFDMDMQGKAIWCCRRNKTATRAGFWASSVMLLDCTKLTHWHLQQQFDEMFAFKRDYMKWVRLRLEQPDSIGELPPEWNSFDRLTKNTKILHNTKRRTQPWKSGLPADYTVRPHGWWRHALNWLELKLNLGTVKGSIPAEGRYLRHPDPAQEQLFFFLLRECLENGSITEAEIQKEIASNHIRHDAIALVRSLSTLPTRLRKIIFNSPPAVRLQ